MDPKERPRVMLVGPMPPLKGGITTFLLNLINSPMNKRYEFVTFSTSRPQKSNVIDNWGYTSMLRGGVRRILYGIALTAWRFLKFPVVLAQGRINLVQTHGSDYQSFWEAMAYTAVSRLMGRRVLLRIGGAFDHFHAASLPIVQRIIQASLRIPHIVIVQSAFARRYVEEVSGINSILILPNWTRAPIYAGDRPLRQNPRFMFIAGNEARRKGVEEVIRAAQILEGKASPARFHMVAIVPQLADRIDQLNLTMIDRIEGFVEQKRILAIMRECDVFLLPSHGEGFPNSLLEAMACSLPSIVTPVAAVPEIVALGGGAIMVPAGDAEALASAIEALASDPQLRRTLGEQARQSVSQNFTAQKVLRLLENAYETLRS